MPVLLLCQGDTGAKDLLRRAIEVRYGSKPPAIETLRLQFKGRARIKLGPVATFVPVQGEARFVFPSRFRWDFVVKPLNLPVQKGSEAYDGTVFRTLRGAGTPEVIQEIQHLVSLRSRLWAMAALLLTPLSDHYTKLTQCGDLCFLAENTKLHDTVQLDLREDYSLKHVSLPCYNQDNEREQVYTMQVSREQDVVDGLMLPKVIRAMWDDEISFEMMPQHAQAHLEMTTSLFTLAKSIS